MSIFHPLWLLFKRNPLIAVALAIELGFGYVLEWVCPRLSLLLAERQLRRVDPRLLTLKKKNHV